MIGLAVGIDYALFIVTRHRQNLAEGLAVDEAAARANATAGSAVVFAGVTVVIAIAGLAVVGIPFLTVMGLATAATVLIAVLIAVTLLPALLGFAGHNIDRWKAPGMKARTGDVDEVETLGARWARRVTAGPCVALVGGLARHGRARHPAASMRLGHDRRRQPAAEATTQRQAYDLLADGFGPGFNGPLTVVVDLVGRRRPEAAARRRSRGAIAADAGVVAGRPAGVNADRRHRRPLRDPRHRPGRRRTPTTSSTACATTCSRRSRPRPEPQVVRHRFHRRQHRHLRQAGRALPIFMAARHRAHVPAAARGRSARSWCPIKAALAILSQHRVELRRGRRHLPVGLAQGPRRPRARPCPIISFMPMMMFAILFGLSMDYEVFIMSRIREEYSRTGAARAERDHRADQPRPGSSPPPPSS